MPKCHTQRLSQRSGVCTSIASASQVVEDLQLRQAGCALRRGVCQKGLRLRRAQLPGGFFFEKKNLEAKLHGKVKLGFSNLKISKILPIWTKFLHQTLSPPPKKKGFISYFFLSPWTAQRTSVWSANHWHTLTPMGRQQWLVQRPQVHDGSKWLITGMGTGCMLFKQQKLEKTQSSWPKKTRIVNCFELRFRWFQPTFRMPCPTSTLDPLIKIKYIIDWWIWDSEMYAYNDTRSTKEMVIDRPGSPTTSNKLDCNSKASQKNEIEN